MSTHIELPLGPIWQNNSTIHWRLFFILKSEWTCHINEVIIHFSRLPQILQN